ncbi:myosin-11-like [Mercenaria mercenaria]|uniref:myosin-11-like n=1 Tax=Mercenaria mercenaria TaxID=6596 RepID=UPI00234F2C6E|nr:myosin-11-like [Mercenaria mercenaria]XP_053389400.1 myosin-11-like [Mercenaria mercenaria]
MGTQASKEENSAELKLAVDRVKNCIENHRSNVCSIDSAVNAQNDSVELLSQMTSGTNMYFRERHCTENEQSAQNGPLDMTQNLLANIQNTLIHQVGALNESFGILENCIREISAHYSPESGSHVDTDRRTLVSARTRTSKDRFSTVMYESERRMNSKEVSSSDAEFEESDIGTVRALRSENKAITSQKNELQMKLKETEEVIKSFQDENRRLNSENENLRRTTAEIGRVQKQKEEFERKCAKLEMENKKLNDDVHRYRSEANACYSLENTIRRLQETVDQQKRRILDLEDEKRKIKERKMIVPVQLFYQRKDELMTLVVKELSLMMDTQMQTKNIQLEIVKCENISRIQPDKPILVLCINSSRLGTDASTAIEGVHKSGRTALLIFHHKNIHALPNQPSDRMLTSSEFKQLGGIIDLAFLTGKGIYPCDMNNLAVSCIESFIQRNVSGK